MVVQPLEEYGWKLDGDTVTFGGKSMLQGIFLRTSYFNQTGTNAKHTHTD